MLKAAATAVVMDMRPQHILTRQHTPTLRSISLRIPSRHTVTAAESASALDTVTTVATVGTMAAIAATTAVTVGTTVEITAGTTVAMVDFREVMAATTADTEAITEKLELQAFIQAGLARQVQLAEFFYYHPRSRNWLRLFKTNRFINQSECPRQLAQAEWAS